MSPRPAQDEKAHFTYVEVLERATKKVIERIDVSDRGESSMDRVERGLNINLNHRDYFTRIAVYKTAQEKPT